MNRRRLRRIWKRLLGSYTKRAFRIFRSSFRETARRIPFETLTEDNFQGLIALNISRNDIFNAYIDVYLQIGELHGEFTGEQINKELKQFENPLFSEALQRSIINYLQLNAGSRIISVRKNLIAYLIDIISQGLADNKPIRQIARELRDFIDDPGFYNWQTLRIARTETTAAANHGAIIAGNSSGVALQKIWISSLDARTRRIPPDRFDHIEMEGITVNQDERFDVQGDLLLFPGDPQGQAANVINCRCTVSLVPQRDNQGRLILLR